MESLVVCLSLHVCVSKPWQYCWMPTCFRASSTQHISGFIDWLCTQLRRPSNPTRSVPTATATLSALLRERGGRQLFLRAGGVALLPPFLKSFNAPTYSQLLYELCMCVWQMTYVKQAAESMGTSGEATRLSLHNILTS